MARSVRSNPTTLVLNTTAAWSAVKRLGNSGRGNSRVVDEHVRAPSACQHLLDGMVDRGIAADIELDNRNALLAQSLRMLAVRRLRIAHGSENRVATARRASAVARPKPCSHR